MSARLTALVALSVLLWSGVAAAQALTQRGFVEGAGTFFPQDAANDSTRAVGELLVREEAFYKPAPWISFAGGIDLRADSHDRVDDSWVLDFSDRGTKRARLSVRRLSATASRGRWTVEAGKQFIRWGTTDIVTPTDHFAPRDFVSVLDSEFLPVLAVRGAVRLGDDRIEAVWTPRFTPSRTPLLDQRWTVVPPEAGSIPLVDAGSAIPGGSQVGIRWAHVGRVLEYSLSYFDGFNHLPTIEAALVPAPPAIAVGRVYPPIRSYGADAAMPTRWLTLKTETAYVTTTSPGADDYVLYVVQAERQSGEWLFVGGYAGEVVTTSRSLLSFAPDRGLTRAIVARASYTIDPNRSVAFESAVRQNGDGSYGKVEYSQARGQHWRVTMSGVAIAGHLDDFLGQYRRNSHVTLALRYSF